MALDYEQEYQVMLYQTRAGSTSEAARWQSERVRPLRRTESALASWALVDDHQSVLEFGLTDGALLQHLMGRYNIRACGASFDAECAQGTRHRLLGAEIIYAAADDIPWRDESFDRVLIDTPIPSRMEGRNWPSEVLRTLKPGGKLLMALPILRHDGTARTLRDRLVRPKDLLSMLSMYGFEDVSYRYALPAHAILIAGKPV